MYLRNRWYVGALASELGRHLLARTLLEAPIVMYRKEDGSPAAVEDRCSHRFYPLSAGELKGDVIVCGYHGLEFDCTGRCVRVPGQERSPSPAANIRHYPIVERWGLMWLWMGDPALADPSSIPDLWRLGDPSWKTIYGEPLPVAGNYQLLTDNLLDPSHVAFLHKTTLGSDVAEIPHESEFFDESVRVRRWTLDKPAAPIFARLGGFTSNVDRWQIITATAPCMIEVDLGSCIAGTGAIDGDRSQGIEMRSYNFATPCERNTFTYFWTHSRNYKLDDDSVSKLTRDQVQVALAEDIGAIEAVQRGFDRFPNIPRFDIRADGAGLRARRMMDALVAEENAAASQQRAPAPQKTRAAS